jgi:hypothetical protein
MSLDYERVHAVDVEGELQRGEPDNKIAVTNNTDRIVNDICAFLFNTRTIHFAARGVRFQYSISTRLAFTILGLMVR